jgi:5-methylcytosine-specific restriction endonuclease McrA
MARPISTDLVAPDATKRAPVAVRYPPLPHWGARKGACRWCGRAVLKPDGKRNLRRRWHDDCVSAYRIACFSGDMREAVYARDGGFCACCGCHYLHATALARPIPDWLPYRQWRADITVANKRWSAIDFADGVCTPIFYARGWTADHIVPLHRVDRSASDVLRYWSLANLQTLCLRCDERKTTEELRRRAAERAAAGAAAPKKPKKPKPAAAKAAPRERRTAA